MSDDAGLRNKRIRIERPVADDAPDGAGSGSWAPVATVSAQVTDALPSRGEKLADGINVASRPARVRIRYREDLRIDGSMRFLLIRTKDDIEIIDRVMQIVAGPAELGFRDRLEFMVEDYSTAGEPGLMVTQRGKTEMTRFMAQLPEQFEKVLRGAGRAAANVIADEVKDRAPTPEIKAAVKVKSEVEGELIIAKVQVIGPGAYVARWAEWGTDEHFITVNMAESGGRTATRLNDLSKKGSLVIGGNFVGAAVLHPGARPYPFFRPSIDIKEREAHAAAQAYINRRVGRTGITVPASEGGE